MTTSIHGKEAIAMRLTHSAASRQQFRFLQRQFLQDGDLPFTNVLTNECLAQARDSIKVVWKDLAGHCWRACRFGAEPFRRRLLPIVGCYGHPSATTPAFNLDETIQESLHRASRPHQTSYARDTGHYPRNFEFFSESLGRG